MSFLYTGIAVSIYICSLLRATEMAAICQAAFNLYCAFPMYYFKCVENPMSVPIVYQMSFRPLGRCLFEYLIRVS